jgi:hypothetical protein
MPKDTNRAMGQDSRCLEEQHVRLEYGISDNNSQNEKRQKTANHVAPKTSPRIYKSEIILLFRVLPAIANPGLPY